MKKLLACCLLGASLIAQAHSYNGKNHLPLAYDDSSMHCYNPKSKVEIGFYISEEIKVYPGMPLQEIIKLNSKNTIKIYFHSLGTEMSFNHSVVATTDGFGNGEYYVFQIDQSYQIQKPLHLYYDHEEGFLRGSIYFSPTYQKKPTIQPFTMVMTSDMNCFDYTWGTGFM